MIVEFRDGTELFYGFDWSRALAAGQSIASASVTTSGLTLSGSPTVDGNRVLAKVTEAEDGATMTATVTLQSPAEVDVSTLTFRVAG